MGKTGTAQKYGENGQIATGKYISSFIGTYPASNPEYIILIVVDEPGNGAYYGSVVASPYAKEIFRQMNLNVNVVPCSSIEFNRKAQRPKYSVLNNSLMCRDWKEALREYLTLRESEGR